jgi:aspartyl/glutamyl-tRNA(Asn/Gln) amidotransferase C subunit
MTYNISDESVQKVAKLARLEENSSPESLNIYSKELNQILGHVDELSKVTIVGSSSKKRTNTVSSLRQDTIRTDTIQYTNTRNAIVSQFPNSQGDLLILPGIFHDN